ncbi:MAG: hypothetical protein IPM42_09400 [Saprospiraceae bacterium]|nr:hypothetical protein [Saprospiraceae bacterium]
MENNPFLNTHILNETKRRFEPINTKCSFCNTGSHNKMMEDNCFSSVYNVRDRTNLLVYRNVKFNEVKIGVPRCKSCRSVHSTVNTLTNIVIIIGVLLVFVVPITISVSLKTSTAVMFVMMALMVGIVYLTVTALDKAILSSNKTLSEKEGALKEPLVLEFLRRGWSLKRPTA